MDATSLKAQLIIELKGLAANFGNDDYMTAFLNATSDTGWSLPITDTLLFRRQWFKERAKRWLFYMLLTEKAESFKVNQLNMQQEFEHLGELVEKMDAAFQAVKEEYPNEFSAANPASAPEDTYKYFGQVAGAGFKYDSFGNDTTYEKDESADQGS